MSTPSKTATPNTGAGRRPSLNPAAKSQNTPARSPSRISNSTTATPAAKDLSRTRSVRTGAGSGSSTAVPPSARAAVRKSVSYAKSNMADGSSEEDARAGAAAAALEDMRERLEKAELAVEEHMKQAAILQACLDDTNQEHSKLEESVHEHQERMEELENERKESVRKCREIETMYESYQAATLKDRDESQSREEDLRRTVQRLKESQRELRVEDEKRPDLSRASSFRSNVSPHLDGSQFAPPSSLERSDSRSSSRLVLQKDKIIEALRLELAEAQIKIAELGNNSGGRVQELERALLEARVTNGRLMEDNESFQLLLSEKTINGDFASSFLKAPSDYGSRPSSRDAPAATSLADELESASEIDAVEHRRLLSDMSALKDQNKALSLYINNIISRLLQHKEFENILDKTPNLMSGSEPSSDPPANANVNKDLPPPPPPKDVETDGAATPSLLQRATSVVRGRQRPQPLTQTSSFSDANPPVTQDPSTAPRVPLNRPQSTRVASGGHRRANSDWSHAAVVGNMYRGPSPASGQISPGIPPQRASTFFSALPSASTPAAMARVPSTSSAPRIADTERDQRNTMPPPASNRDSKVSSSRNSMVSESGINPSSPPRSIVSGANEKPSGAIMGGNKMRPLRLVQEATEEQEAAKKANRSSWMGWFNKGSGAPAPRSVSAEVVPKE